MWINNLQLFSDSKFRTGLKKQPWKKLQMPINEHNLFPFSLIRNQIREYFGYFLGIKNKICDLWRNVFCSKSLIWHQRSEKRNFQISNGRDTNPGHCMKQIYWPLTPIHRAYPVLRRTLNRGHRCLKLLLFEFKFSLSLSQKFLKHQISEDFL